jgi:hypothetical protein
VAWLRNWAEESDLHLGPETNMPRWDGTSPDYELAVSELLAAGGDVPCTRPEGLPDGCLSIRCCLSKVLDAEIREPHEINSDRLQNYDLIGFGSGIYHSENHRLLLDLADRLSEVNKKKAFIFSTCGAPGFAVEGGHVDEFICPGWNTNKFLKLIGGINKGRPALC